MLRGALPRTVLTMCRELQLPGERIMFNKSSRRQFLETAAMALPLAATRLHAQSASSASLKPQISTTPGSGTAVADTFPTQPPELVREMVMVSHFNLKRVKELVTARPSLAKAAWDWGFGDWESALGAASHMGNRAIAEYLLANGARPSLFSAAMLGQLDVVKAFIAAQPGIQRTAGPHSISLLAHAKSGGEAARGVHDYLQSLGDADAPPEAVLSDADRASILGTYLFGTGPTEQVEVSVQQGRLTWTRKGTIGRWLIHLGDRVFFPCGAPSVRIRFAEEKDMRVMTVSDPELVLTAAMKTGQVSG
jgi:hypothetical protein